MITLIRISDGKIKTMSERSFKALKGKVQGYRLKEKPLPEKKPFEKKAVAKEPDVVKNDQPTREQMFEYLSSKGVKTHPNIGDEKLRKRYELEIETDKS